MMRIINTLKAVNNSQISKNISAVILIGVGTWFFFTVQINDFVADLEGDFTNNTRYFLAYIISLGLACASCGSGAMLISLLKLMKKVKSFKANEHYPLLVEHLLWSVIVVSGFIILFITSYFIF